MTGILDIGPAADVAKRHEGGKFDRVMDGRMLGICPGFVDSHVHLSETLSRAVFPDNLNTRAWVFHWAKPFYAHITEEDAPGGAHVVRLSPSALAPFELDVPGDPSQAAFWVVAACVVPGSEVFDLKLPRQLE